ncbi:MAG: sigma-70 family RNA polymerase sigma factor [Candidatus Devosia phytovorans]|uniref:RNA polymerase sigma factor n=1 Tax=Candidatus Devosia phytovorans TaxID=3121372 RepID=A0AAJ5VZT1_9HYPH|nr:sigma-70 family RNA polymerase sigma factor [Devosia sp.]WEK06407.1 MAG: sigma-70 family RNA polymerase sigma factor [Devosia sp.]
MTNSDLGDFSTLPGPQDLGQLVLRIAQKQDRSALADLFGQLGPRVKSMLLKLGASDALAEDLVQETFLTVWRKAPLYSSQRGAVTTWIFTIARNLRIDQLRRQSNKPYEDLEKVALVSDSPLGSAVVEQHQVVDRVTAALGSLSEEQREVVRLSFIHDMPHAQIAEAIGIPLGTVKSRLRLAYERLRPLLEDLQ